MLSLHRHSKRLVGLLIGVLAVLLLPVAPASAALNSTPIFIDIHTFQGTRLAVMNGTLLWTGGSSFTYTYWLCRESSYTQPNVRFTTGFGVYAPGPDANPVACRFPNTPTRNGGEVTSAAPITSLTITLQGVEFNPYNGAREYFDTQTLDNPFN